MSAAGEKLVEAARQVSGSRVGPAHGWEWVELRMSASSSDVCLYLCNKGEPVDLVALFNADNAP
jgi:hypothetical protein